jgi:two-component system LytT family response regulator
LSGMLRTIIIDDDPKTCEILAHIINDYCPNVTLVARAGDVRSGVAAIIEHEPDLILLDIKMPDGSGYDLIKHFDKPDFKVIIISGYLEYAIKGYKYGVIDYILKPVDLDEFIFAINKADDMVRFEEKLRFKALADNINLLSKAHKIILKTSEHIHLINIGDIIRIVADGNYCTFFICDGRKILISRPIREYEKLLIDKGFHRIHKTHIININKVSYFDKTDGGDVVMSDGSKVPVSSRKKEELLSLLESLIHDH